MPPLSTLEGRYFATGTDTGPVASDNGQIEMLMDGNAYFSAVRTAIDGATGAGDIVYVTGWWVEYDCPTLLPTSSPNARELEALLAEKAHVGVDVRVLIWANPHLIDSPTLGSFVGATGFLNVVSSNIRSAAAMRTHKPTGATAPPLADRVLLDHSGGIRGSHHQKSVLVRASGQASAFVSGIDFQAARWDATPHNTRTRTVTTSTSGGSPVATTLPWGWHDAGVKITGPAVDTVLENFRSRWSECMTLPARTYSLAGGPATSYNPTATTAPVASFSTPAVNATPRQSIQVLRTLPTVKIEQLFGSDTGWSDPALGSGLHHVRATLLKALAAAKRYIYIEDQAFDAPATLFPALVAACANDVKVMAVTPGVNDPHDGAGDPTVPRVVPDHVQDDLIDKVATGKRSNLALYHVDQTTIHSKIILIDDEFLCIGSANFMDRSMQDTSNGGDSELSVAAVDAGTLVRDARRTLWSDHLRVSPSDPTVQNELNNLDIALGLWRNGWATSGAGPTFARPNSKLAFVGP